MKKDINRRKFLSTASGVLVVAGGSGVLSSCGEEETGSARAEKKGTVFPISLAQWSFHNALFGGQLDNLDYPKTAKELGINAVEWVNHFCRADDTSKGYQPKGKDYLAQMKQRAADQGVKSVLIMCDRVGNLGNPDAAKRTAAVEGHYAWCEAAKFLGCHSIRVNAASDHKLSPEEQADLCTDGLGRLSEFAGKMGLGVIVENHGGLSSNGAWLSKVMKSVNRDNCGTLPDFGNFYVLRRGKLSDADWEKRKAPFSGDPVYVEDETGLEYDRYKGTEQLMPFAKGVSAKSHDFNAAGEETHTDYKRMMQIVKDSGYKGHIGIEYEGKKLSEPAGVKATKALLEKGFELL